MLKKRTLERIKRLAERLQDEAPEMPGGFNEYGGGVDDGGGYGDPHADDKPDFVKEDERGWTKLGRLGGD